MVLDFGCGVLKRTVPHKNPKLRVFAEIIGLSRLLPAKNTLDWVYLITNTRTKQATISFYLESQNKDFTLKSET